MRERCRQSFADCYGKITIGDRGGIICEGTREMTLGLPTFVGDDIDALRGAARANLGFFTALPFFQRLLRASGFSAEADKAEQGRAARR